MQRLNLRVVVSVLAISVVGGPLRPSALERSVPQPPAGIGSGMYSLAAGRDDVIYLSWIEPAGEKSHALRFSTLERGTWTPARTIAAGSNWFVNWADHPSLVPLPDGSLVAHWLVDNDAKKGSYGYGLRIARSTDRGATWREVFSAGSDNVTGYSGFVSVLPQDHGFIAVYLGPPDPKHGDHASGGEHVMGLSVATFDADGRLLKNAVVDADTCTCCPTAVATTPRGPLVAYRDHTGETRDISVLRYDAGRWIGPKSIHPDGWRINACPTNGPTLAAHGDHVAAAWFTAADDMARVQVAFSNDAGGHFAEPFGVDGGRPVGWTGIALADDGSAIVSWLEAVGEGRGEIRVRRAWPDGRLSDPVVVATSSAGRSTGVPQMVRSGDHLVVAWRTDRVLTAVVPVPEEKVARTADGHPDLQGIWDNSTVTPLERPKELAEQAFFTEDEAAEYVKHGLDRFRAARGEVEVQTNGEINGIWSGPARVGDDRRTSIITDPADGRLPALTPDAQKRVAARADARKQHPFDGPEDLTLGERCIMWGAGPPMLPTPQNSMLQIVQTRDHVLILNEMIHDVRVVPLDGRPHLPPEIRQLKGDPRGHWDGDTLVVDTTNFTDKTELRGTSAARHVVERFTLTGTDTIRYQFTVDDPTSLTRPWSGELFLKRTDDRIFEYACHEANYSMAMILRGARAGEPQ